MDEQIAGKKTTHWYRIREHYMKRKAEGLPKMSVIIPSYNQAHVLALTMRGVYSQQNVDVELIIVDAGSDDHTMDLMELHKERIFRVYYVTDYNIPLMINKGASLATGKYISILFPGYNLLNRYSLCHMARLAQESNWPDFMFCGNYLTESTYPTYRKAMTQSIEELDPNFALVPFSRAWLRRGFLPTAPYCMWFEVDRFKNMEGLNYSYLFQKSLLDFLCRLHKEKELNVASTFWAATINDWRMEKATDAVKDFFGRWQIILKHFGIVDAMLWPLRHKPFRFFHWCLQRLRLFFKEN